jgi:hypothetical protein
MDLIKADMGTAGATSFFNRDGKREGGSYMEVDIVLWCQATCSVWAEPCLNVEARVILKRRLWRRTRLVTWSWWCWS